MAIMISIGLNLNFRELFVLWRKPGLLARPLRAAAEQGWGFTQEAFTIR